jgi:hypothetical protein
VEYAFSSRASGAALVAGLRSDDGNVFLGVGAVTDVIENLPERLNTYAAQLPKQARWHRDSYHRMTGAPGVEGARGDVHELGTAARRASDFLDEAPSLLGAERDMLDAERRALLANVNNQRGQTLGYIAAKRLAVVAAAREERIALLSALRQERIETLVGVDAIKTGAIDSGLTGLRDLIDYTLRRVALLTLCLMLAAARLTVIAYRLAVSQRGST